MIVNTIQNWTERLRARISDDSGVTLIELLVTLAISAILLPVVYGAFITGYKVYEKVSIDAQLREDADYVSAIVMNQLYSYPLDEVAECSTASPSCIKFINNTEIGITKAPADDGEEKEFYDINDQNVLNDSIVFNLENTGDKQQWKLGSTIIETSSDFAGSTVSFSCADNLNPCSEAIIQIHFEVSHPNFNKTLHLESNFGF
jgi:prepilin-type N-terminal cleavage/methylation domain-containing protein